MEIGDWDSIELNSNRCSVPYRAEHTVERQCYAKKHIIKKCSCGQILSICPDPSTEGIRAEIIVNNACNRCRDRPYSITTGALTREHLKRIRG